MPKDMTAIEYKCKGCTFTFWVMDKVRDKFSVSFTNLICPACDFGALTPNAEGTVTPYE